ncbi:MAG: glycosyltransferase family 4 protein [Actinomycetota bacterium]
MKLIYVSRSALPRFGGIEAHLDRVATGLARRDHSVRIFASRIDNLPFTRLNTTLAAQRFEPIRRDGVETLPLPLSNLGRMRMLPASIGSLKGADAILGYDRVREWTLAAVADPIAHGLKAEVRSADLVHSWGGEPVMFGALNAARLERKPFVITPFAHPGSWGDDKLNATLYARSDAVIALLPSEATFYESLGVDPSKIHVIPVAAPTPQAPVLPEKPPGFLVVFLGVKRRYKYKALLDALPLIARRDVRFAFIGPETPESKADFASVNDDRIIRAAAVTEPGKWGWLDVCDVLCLPSVSEILPVSILEAWQKRKPVVVAEGRFTRDLVSDHVDGFVCGGDKESIANAIEEALEDPHRLIAMGAAGAAKVAERFDQQKVVAAHEALYSSLA